MSMGNDVKGSAAFSLDLRYRQQLDRWWSDTPRALVCMANPSIAGGAVNDPTIHSLIRLLRPLNGCGGFTVVNYVPYIATSPDEMRAWEATMTPETLLPIVQSNMRLIRHLSRDAFIRIVAWGNIVPEGLLSNDTLDAMSLSRTENLYALGLTKSGAPKHPMARGKSRIPDGTIPIIWKDYV